MKVCSQCEFIYEDDQSLCDMDGAALIYDPAPRALTQVAAPESGPPLANSRWKRLAATAVAGIVLGTVLVLIFQVLVPTTQGQLSTTAPQNPNYSSTQASGNAGPPNLDLGLPVPLSPAVEALPLLLLSPVEALPAPASNTSPQSGSPLSTPLPGRSPKANEDVLPLPRAKATSNVSLGTPSTPPSRKPRLAAATRKRERANSRAAEANHKESKIGSLLKKTGHILKKPFEF